MKIFVDTSALLALLGADDRWHDAAVAIYRELALEAELVTTNYVAVETIRLTRQRLGVEAANALIERHLPIITTVWVDEDTHRRAMTAYRPDGETSVVDEASFAVMRGLGIEVAFAFDPDFERNGFRAATAAVGRPRRWLREAPASYDSDERRDIVGIAEIARRSGSSVNTVQSWRRRHADFPRPVARLGAGPIWSWPDINQWIAGRSGRAPRAGRADDRHGSTQSASEEITKAIDRSLATLGPNAEADTFVRLAARRTLEANVW